MIAETRLYAAYVPILALGLRRGEVLGLRWADVDLGTGEILIGWQLQQINGLLLHRKPRLKPRAQPFPSWASAPPRSGSVRRSKWRHGKGDRVGAVGSCVHDAYRAARPRNFDRSFVAACDRAGVRRLPVHVRGRSRVPWWSWASIRAW
ncbi:hypothetical protein GCM10022214_16940 [Actinomadura miaoliensis]|uniref:Tyr recombinase domain-containing protein n=1 Tax=Actinomadura miaoliensis TaxID=430685 RepID=A0ABP7VE21_9ACTN